MLTLTIANCKCGLRPELIKIGEWPAQYRITCTCGESVLGLYYGSHDESYRHKAAKKSAIERWNSGERTKG